MPALKIGNGTEFIAGGGRSIPGEELFVLRLFNW